MPYAASAGAEDVNTPVIRWKGFEQVNINTVGNPDEVTDELWNSYYTSISACNTLIKIIGENTKLSPDELSPIGGKPISCVLLITSSWCVGLAKCHC